MSKPTEKTTPKTKQPTKDAPVELQVEELEERIAPIKPFPKVR